MSHTTSQVLEQHADIALNVRRQMQRWQQRATRLMRSRRFIRLSLLFGNVLLLVGVFVYVSGSNSQAMDNVALPASPSAVTNPLDQLSAADIAVNIAETTRLPETTAVTNQADSVHAALAAAPVTSTVVAEPQEVATNFKSRFDIQSYTVKSGDTIANIASQFNVTSNSIIWSNGLSGNTVAAGTKLFIPPVNGIVYTVKSGDTPQSLAQKYSADQAQIVAFNDAEISGLQTGEQIVIPNGLQPAAQSTKTYGSFGTLLGSGALSASYAGFGQCEYGGKVYSNYGYDCGFCTWWAAMKRATSGDPVPSNLGEAYSWLYSAAAMGIPEGTTPQPGAVIWFPDDHVAYVESVAADGTTTISEMNHLYWGVEDARTFSPAQAASYHYIY